VTQKSPIEHVAAGVVVRAQTRATRAPTKPARPLRWRHPAPVGAARGRGGALDQSRNMVRLAAWSAPGAPGAQPRAGRIVQSRRFPPPWYVAEGAPLALSFSEVGPVLAEKLFGSRGASSGLKVSIRDQ
jgi:hypothetical protein